MITVRSASRPPVRGSSSSDELGDDVGHLVAALAAADVDDDVGVAPLGDLLQQQGLAGAEPAGDGGGAAPGDREQHVEDPLAGHQRRRRCRAAPGAAGVGGRARSWRAGRRRRRRGRPARRRSAVPSDASCSSTPPTPGGTRTRCSTDPASATVPSTSPDRTVAPSRAVGTNRQRRTRPVRRAPGRSQVGAPRERPQEAVEDAAEQAGAQSGRQRRPASRRRVAGAQAARVLVGLHGDPLAADRHHLRRQGRRTQVHDLAHRGAVEAGDVDQRPVDPEDGTGCPDAWVPAVTAPTVPSTCGPSPSTVRSASAPRPGRRGGPGTSATTPPSGCSRTTAVGTELRACDRRRAARAGPGMPGSVRSRRAAARLRRRSSS